MQARLADELLWLLAYTGLSVQRLGYRMTGTPRGVVEADVRHATPRAVRLPAVLDAVQGQVDLHIHAATLEVVRLPPEALTSFHMSKQQPSMKEADTKHRRAQLLQAKQNHLNL